MTDEDFVKLIELIGKLESVCHNVSIGYIDGKWKEVNGTVYTVRRGREYYYYGSLGEHSTFGDYIVGDIFHNGCGEQETITTILKVSNKV